MILGLLGWIVAPGENYTFAIYVICDVLIALLLAVVAVHVQSLFDQSDQLVLTRKWEPADKANIQKPIVTHVVSAQANPTSPVTVALLYE